jgi:hypothetical protein
MEWYGLSLVTQMAFTTLLRLEQRSPLTVHELCLLGKYVVTRLP